MHWRHSWKYLPKIRDRDSFYNSGLGPGLKFKFCGTWDWDRDGNLKYPGPRLTIFSSGTEILSSPGCVPNSAGQKGQPEFAGSRKKTRDWDRDAKTKNPGFGTGTQNWWIRDRGLGPGLNFAGLSRGLKIFPDTVPVLWRPLVLTVILLL